MVCVVRVRLLLTRQGEAIVTSKVRSVFEVQGSKYHDRWLCETPTVTAAKVIQNLNAREKKAITVEALVPLIRQLKKGQDHRIFGCYIRRKSLFVE